MDSAQEISHPANLAASVMLDDPEGAFVSRFVASNSSAGRGIAAGQ
jgi:hypothetical protein